MFGNILFGRKEPPKSPPASLSVSKNFPWDGSQDYAAANFALGDLVFNVQRVLTVNGGLHAETLMAAIGAVAGYAAQQALLARFSEQGESAEAGKLLIMKTANGGEFFFGDALNETLISQSTSTAESFEKLWPLAQGAAVAAGLDQARLPSVDSMFKHVVATIGCENEGGTSLENCRFQASAKVLLKGLWPIALQCFNSELSGRVIQPRQTVSHRWRPVVAALAAHRMIREVAGILPPLSAVTIVMEVAIYASKLTPKTLAMD